MLPVVVVHGGAGQIPKERVEESTSGVCSAARAGYGVLLGGGSSVDAVVEAVSLMENNPAFNAGNVLERPLKAHADSSPPTPPPLWGQRYNEMSLKPRGAL